MKFPRVRPGVGPLGPGPPIPNAELGFGSYGPRPRLVERLDIPFANAALGSAATATRVVVDRPTMLQLVGDTASSPAFAAVSLAYTPGWVPAVDGQDVIAQGLTTQRGRLFLWHPGEWTVYASGYDQDPSVGVAGSLPFAKFDGTPAELVSWRLLGWGAARHLQRRVVVSLSRVGTLVTFREAIRLRALRVKPLLGTVALRWETTASATSSDFFLEASERLEYHQDQIPLAQLTALGTEFTNRNIYVEMTF